MKHVKSIDEFVEDSQNSDELDEGLIKFFREKWFKLIKAVKGDQKRFLKKMEKEPSKAKRVRMLNARIEKLAQKYIHSVTSDRSKIYDIAMIDIERDLVELFKLFTKITGEIHSRDVHRKTGLFDRVFLWPDLLRKGVTKEDIEQAYRDKIESIRVRAARKIQKAEEELDHFMMILA